eukprot:gene13571-biopygen13957
MGAAHLVVRNAAESSPGKKRQESDVILLRSLRTRSEALKSQLPCKDEARKQRFDGLNAWANFPFSVMYEILLNFLKCKRKQQMGTSGCFLVPVWEGGEAYELVSGMREVFRPVRKYRAGTMLFTAPALDGKGRSEWGPTRWDVLVVRVPMEPVELPDWDGAYAESTQRSYDTGVKAFLTFCVRFACLGTLEPLLLASDATLARFIAFSAWFVQPGMIKGCAPAKPVMPITLRDLARMAEFADMETITGLALWAAILMGFYGLFRKDNLTVGKSQAWNARGALVREDVLFAEAGDVVWIRVRHSKTIHPGEATPPGEPERGRGARGAPDGEIVAEPEVGHAEDVTMASDDREPEPAGETREMQVEDAEPWWARLRKMLVVPVWDAAGAPLPAAPASAPAVPPAGTGCGEHYPAVAESRSARWPALRVAIVKGAMARGLSGTGTTEEERARFQQEVRDVGAQVLLMSERAHLLAEALKDWPDVAFLVRGAACGVGFPFAGKEPDEPYIVEDYVGDEHEEATTKELAKEMAAGRIFDARDWLPRGVSALGMKDEFTSVKDAYALLRPGMYMVKVDLEEAYRLLPVASQYWAAQCFQWRGVRYMDTRSPFGNRALPGSFMRYTRAIVAWMQAQGVPCVGYLDDFFMVARTAA